jgi:hypothetical protein
MDTFFDFFKFSFPNTLMNNKQKENCEECTNIETHCDQKVVIFIPIKIKIIGLVPYKIRFSSQQKECRQVYHYYNIDHFNA